MLNEKVRIKFLFNEFSIFATFREINFAMQDEFSIKNFKNDVITL